MKKWLVRAALVAVILEVVYVVVINTALNLPYTQTLINDIKPQKFAVYWEKAWSIRPFKVHVRGISANGQSSSQQWQVDSPAASASISLLPLLGRTVDIHGLKVADVKYSQRPRPKAGKDFADTRQFFPVIKDRKPERTPSVQPSKKKGKPWHIELTNAHARGSHRLWIYQIQSDFHGDVKTDFAIQTRRGPLSLRNGVVDLNLDTLLVNGNREIVNQGHIRGTIELGPFVPSENKGAKMLAFLKAAITVDTQAESLAFLNLYLNRFHGMKVNGAGKLSGLIAMEGGKLKPNTDLKVSARELTMDLLSYHTEGTGNIHINVDAANPDTAQVAIAFGALKAFHTDSEAPLLSGDGLEVKGKGATVVVPISNETFEANYLSVTIPSVKVPDLHAYQRYLPKKWSFKLHGGQGELQGSAELTNKGFSTHMKLVSEEADLGLKDYRFTTNLDMAISADCPSLVSSGIDISGTYIRLEKSRLSRQQQERSKPWHTSLAVEKGVVKLNLPEEISKEANIRQLWAALEGKDVVAFLDTENEELKLKGRISDLRWLNLLLKNTYNLAVDGAGEITADVNIASGWLAQGTVLKVHPQELNVNILDYVVTGDGLVTLAVEKGGEHPDVNLNVEIDNALFKRRTEEKAFIENVTIAIQALGRGMSYNGPGGDVELDLRIPAASVKDMSVYNRYLPPQSPFQFESGKADLTADIHLQPKSAAGFIKLITKGMRSRIDEQHIEGEVTADIKLAGGVPQNMNFDISGSSIVLDRVRITGKEQTFQQPDWYARFTLKKGHAIWKKPTRIEVEADLEIKDTRPIVAILANQRGKHGWLEKTLTVDNVRGEATVDLTQEQIIIPYAFVGSNDIEVGAKGFISPQLREGIFYVRFKKLDGILKVRNKDRNFDILKARKKFDDYSPGSAKLD